MSNNLRLHRRQDITAPMSGLLDSVRPLSSMVMGTISGFFISIPVAVSSQGIVAFIVLLAGSLAGFLVGYRRRHSIAFFYFSLVCVLVLASTISLNMFEWRK